MEEDSLMIRQDDDDVIYIVFSVCIVKRVAVGACVCEVFCEVFCQAGVVCLFNTAFCMTCSLLMLVEDATCDHIMDAA